MPTEAQLFAALDTIRRLEAANAALERRVAALEEAFVDSSKKTTTLRKASGVGAFVRQLYLSRGLNRNSFARQIGAAYTTVNDWERIGAVPKQDKLQAIIRTLRLTPDEGTELLALYVANETHQPTEAV